MNTQKYEPAPPHASTYPLVHYVPLVQQNDPFQMGGQWLHEWQLKNSEKPSFRQASIIVNR